MNQNQVLPNCDQLAKCFSKSFKHLNAEQMNLLFWEEECVLLKRGRVIYAEGDSAKGCYFVYSGILKVFKTGLEGKEQIIRFSKSGDIIGFRSALSEAPEPCPDRAGSPPKIDSIVVPVPTRSYQGRGCP